MILDTLKSLDETRHDAIENWFAEKRKEAAPFLYTSVDLRHSGLRLAPVDTNLYPAGFHNLSPHGQQRASRFFARYLKEHFPHTKRVLLIPENHTRNLAYLDNLAALQQLLTQAGMETEIGSLVAEAPLQLQTASGKTITEHPVKKENGTLFLDSGFTPDLIVLNNDMTSGIPLVLQGAEQPIVPPPEMGWWRRRKSVHFAAYKNLAEDFAKTFLFDPWLIAAEFHSCGRVNFKQEQGLDCVAKGVDKVLARAREKHKEYGIDKEPYVFIKADSGTYGMGIMTARSGDELLSINKKIRNKMHVIKEGAEISEVIIQEGVATIDTVDGKPAEPMVYMVDGIPAGGMYRVNGNRDSENNLNAAGMEFTGMCDEIEEECGKWKAVGDCSFRSFGMVAAIAALAAAREEYSLTREVDASCRQAAGKTGA
jgi:glutamate--cysteine ligase